MQVFKKLKSKKGESLSEVLIASLVIMMAFLLMHNAIIGASKMVEKADDNYKRTVNEYNALNKRDGEKNTGEIVIKVDGSEVSIPVDLYKSRELEGDTDRRQSDNVVFDYKEKAKEKAE